MTPRDLVHDHEPDIVPVALILRAGIAQSDEQAHGLSIRELERIRDENLVAIMDALSRTNRGRGWGAGALYRDYVKTLSKRAAQKPASGTAGRTGEPKKNAGKKKRRA